jgi:hypothetical protein
VEVVTATVLKYTKGVDRPGSLEDGTLPWYLGEDIKTTANQIAQVTFGQPFMNDTRGQSYDYYFGQL